MSQKATTFLNRLGVSELETHKLGVIFSYIVTIGHSSNTSRHYLLSGSHRCFLRIQWVATVITTTHVFLILSIQ